MRTAAETKAITDARALLDAAAVAANNAHAALRTAHEHLASLEAASDAADEFYLAADIAWAAACVASLPR